MKKILFLGDSITDCGHCFTADGLGTGYVKLLNARLNSAEENYTLINGGTDGFTFPRVYKKYQDFYSNSNYDLAVITGGINDTSALADTRMPEKDQERFLEYCMYALKEILHLLTERGTGQIIVVEPFLFKVPAWRMHWFPVLEHVRIKMQSVLSGWPETTMVRMQPLFDQLVEQYGADAVTTDGIHLTEMGQKVLADEIQKVILDRC